MPITKLQHDDYMRGSRDPRVAAFLLLSLQYDFFVVYHLIPLYKDNPTKKKAIAIYDNLLSPDAAYSVNVHECEALTTLSSRIERYRTEREGAQRLSWIKRIKTSQSRKAERTVFDAIISEIMGHNNSVEIFASATAKTSAKQLVCLLVAAGFKELKKLCLD